MAGVSASAGRLAPHNARLYPHAMVYTVDRALPAGPESESRPKRVLRWIEVPTAGALISALVVHLLLRSFPVSDHIASARDCTTGMCGASLVVGHVSADAIASIAAVLTLLTVATYRTCFRGR